MKLINKKFDEILNKFEYIERNYSNLYNNAIQSDEISVSEVINEIENNIENQSNDLEDIITNFASKLNLEDKNIEKQLENQQQEFQCFINKLIRKCNGIFQGFLIKDNINYADNDQCFIIEQNIDQLYTQLRNLQNYSENLKQENKHLKEENESLKLKIEDSENNYNCNTADTCRKRVKTSDRWTPNSSVFDSDSIYHFTNNSKFLNKLNINLGETNIIELNVPEKLSYSTAYCLLPDDKIFCYGNYREDGRYSGIAFIINKDYSVDILEAFAPCAHSGCAYFNGYVFVFGGKNSHGDLNIAAKYSLKDRIWERLRNLPVPSHGCSVAHFNKDFYISGINHTTIYAYNLENNAYAERDIKFQVGVPRIICCFTFVITICDSNNNRYISRDGRNWKDKKVSGFPNIIPSSYKIRYKELLYFCCENSYYKYNPKAKDKIKQIAKLIY
ncbi:unnamed protein product [Blepharisma stoltei]|uniref:Uncharacterized protein n=1 Tax=Blepharisma stoltei TaxID=1481888 RepID=A0AAU9J815_9CILI|nr:unnamed protein product [Blepharisma stoltei]